MRIRNLKDTEIILATSPYLLTNPADYKGHFNKLFANDNPLEIEIGMGKGNFIINMAQSYPSINFIGIEKYSSVLCRAIKKCPEYLPNLYFIREDALNLTDFFSKEIDCIYLNFSDPWPKKRYAKRRLTSPEFLKIYEQLFKSSKKIILKTDNDDFFNYSLETLKTEGYTIKNKTNDLVNSDIFNIPTEYETKFVQMGIKINYLKAFKK